MSKSVFGAGLAIVLSGMVAAAPAVAAEPNTAVRTPAPAATSSPAQIRKPTRYCVEAEMTGSRINRKICETRDGWLRRGFDPLVK